MKYIEKGKGLSYYEDELDFIDYSDEPDYWEKLKHQYAGMAMQGMFANPAFKNLHIRLIVLGAVGAATKLINELKEDSQCEK